MPRAAALTEATIKAAKAGAGSAREIPDGAMPGLYLVVFQSGKKGWVVRYRFEGKTRKLTLAQYPILGVKDARDRARDALQALSQGTDPAARKRVARQTESLKFRAVLTDFLKRHLSKRKESYYVEAARLLNKEVLPFWADRNIRDLKKREVIAVLDKIVDRGHTTTANRVLAAVRKLFNWCVERDLLAASPCHGVRPPGRETQRDRVLLPNELKALWQASEAMGYPFGPLIRLLLLTGQRRSEVAELRAEELDLDAAMWTIPAARSKKGKEHHVPLSQVALQIVRTLPQTGHLFTTGDTPVSGWGRAKSILDREMQAVSDKPIAHFTLHDLRRTAASGMAQLGHPPHIVEAVLNHRSGTITGVAAVYNRYNYADEKRKALADWSQYVESLSCMV